PALTDRVPPTLTPRKPTFRPTWLYHQTPRSLCGWCNCRRSRGEAPPRCRRREDCRPDGPHQGRRWSASPARCGLRAAPDGAAPSTAAGTCDTETPFPRALTYGFVSLNCAPCVGLPIKFKAGATRTRGSTATT